MIPTRTILQKDERGAAIMEFALIAPVFCFLLLGGMDFAHWAYVRAIASGSIEQVARSAGVGGAAVDPRVFETQVETRIRKVAKTATFQWTKQSYYQFSGIGMPEKLVGDKNGNGSYDAGDCWQDLNPNGVYDTNPGRDGVGGADDIVFYKLVVTFPPIIPMGKFNSRFLGDHTSTVSTIVRRQPYAAQTVPPIRC